MKRILLLVSAIVLIASCSDDSSTGPDPNQGAVVSMPGGDIFVPFTTTIKVGASVEFDFPSNAHNVIFQKLTGAPTDIQVVINMKVKRTFTVAGTFPYDCTIHPGMSGQVIVTP